jgi:hypothetical protein
VAWAEQLNPVIVFRRQLHGVGLVEGHLQAQGLGEEADRSRVVVGGGAKPDQTFTLITIQTHMNCCRRAGVPRKRSLVSRERGSLTGLAAWE